MTNHINTSNFILPNVISAPSCAKSDEPGHAVIILASGLSQRLGQSKQLLSKHGELLIRYMTRVALATQPHIVIVVIPQHQPVISDAINGLINQYVRIQSVVNSVPETGMGHSLYLGIEALTNFDSSLFNRVLIMGVDQILLTNDHLMKLLAAKSSVVASSYQHLDESRLNEQKLNKPCIDESISTDNSRENIIGLPIVINYERLKQWQSVLIGDKGLRHLIRALPPNQLSTVINHQLGHDIDTPKQLSYARQQRWL